MLPPLNANLPIPVAGAAVSPKDSYRGAPSSRSGNLNSLLTVLDAGAKGAMGLQRIKNEHDRIEGAAAALNVAADVEFEQIRNGKLAPNRSLAYNAGLREETAKSRAYDFINDKRQEYANSELRFSTNPQSFDEWLAPQLGEFMGQFGNDHIALGAALPILQNGSNALENQATQEQAAYARKEFQETQNRNFTGYYESRVNELSAMPDGPEKAAASQNFENDVVSQAKTQAAQQAQSGTVDPITADNNAFDRVLQTAVNYGDLDLLLALRDNGEFAMTPERQAALDAGLDRIARQKQQKQNQADAARKQAAEAETMARQPEIMGVVRDAQGDPTKIYRELEEAGYNMLDPAVQKQVSDAIGVYTEYTDNKVGLNESRENRATVMDHVFAQEPKSYVEAERLARQYMAENGGNMRQEDIEGVYEDIHAAYTTDGYAPTNKNYKRLSERLTDEALVSKDGEAISDGTARAIANTAMYDATEDVLGPERQLSKNPTEAKEQLRQIEALAREKMASDGRLTLGVSRTDPAGNGAEITPEDRAAFIGDVSGAPDTSLADLGTDDPAPVQFGPEEAVDPAVQDFLAMTGADAEALPDVVLENVANSLEAGTLDAGEDAAIMAEADPFEDELSLEAQRYFAANGIDPATVADPVIANVERGLANGTLSLSDDDQTALEYELQDAAAIDTMGRTVIDADGNFYFEEGEDAEISQLAFRKAQVDKALTSPLPDYSVAAGPVTRTPANQDLVVTADFSTSAGRAERARNGGATILLDSNAVGPEAGTNGITQPLIVIPDNATPEQRAAAQAYVEAVADWTNEVTGRKVKGRVVTRSENGRGRSNAFHTEPFALTDPEMLAIMQSPEGMAMYRQILMGTLGTIPGAEFTLPHSPTDPGAVANGTNEVELARQIMIGL